MYKYIKRFLDIIFSGLGLLLLSPVFLICALIIKITSKGPIFFIQKRVGFNSAVFSIIKFRTMDDAINCQTDKDENRLTKIGKVLRSTSIDEIPQLINVLKGDMSFIGPRPLPVQYLEWYTEEENKRHSVRPGISGLAQVNGRNSITWKDKFYFDLNYVNNLSLKLDIIILIKTLKKVLRRSDIIVRGNNFGEEDFDKVRRKEREILNEYK